MGPNPLTRDEVVRRLRNDEPLPNGYVIPYEFIVSIKPENISAGNGDTVKTQAFLTRLTTTFKEAEESDEGQALFRSILANPAVRAPAEVKTTNLFTEGARYSTVSAYIPLANVLLFNAEKLDNLGESQEQKWGYANLIFPAMHELYHFSKTKRYDMHAGGSFMDNIADAACEERGAIDTENRFKTIPKYASIPPRQNYFDFPVFSQSWLHSLSDADIKQLAQYERAPETEKSQIMQRLQAKFSEDFVYMALFNLGCNFPDISTPDKEQTVLTAAQKQAQDWINQMLEQSKAVWQERADISIPSTTRHSAIELPAGLTKLTGIDSQTHGDNGLPDHLKSARANATRSIVT